MPLQLIYSHFWGGSCGWNKRRVEMRPKKRLGRLRCSYVMCVESFSVFLPAPADTPPPPGCMAAGSGGEMRKQNSGVVDCVRATNKKKEKKKKRGGIKNRREEEVILWATAFRMTGLSWEISVKRARELFSCFPLFRDISCGILLFSVTGLFVDV